MREIIKQKKWIILGGICILTLIGGNRISAYFTDHEKQTNILTVGRVSINLFEPHWDGEEENGPDIENPPEDPELGVNKGKDIYPLKEIPKDPTIKNTGIHSSWIYMQVKVPKANIITAEEDGTRNEKKDTQLFTYEIDENWEDITPSFMQEENKTSKEYNTYVYAYKDFLEGSKNLVTGSDGIYDGEKTTPLFEKIVFANVVEGQGLEEKELTIPIVAMAIQSEHTGNYREAYEKYMNQNKEGGEVSENTENNTTEENNTEENTTEENNTEENMTEENTTEENTESNG